MLIVEDLVVDPVKHRARRSEIPLKLNPTNIEILALLMQRSPAVVSREEIATILWGDALRPLGGVGTRIYHIRRVLDDVFSFPLIHTVHGVGYQLYKPTGTPSMPRFANLAKANQANQ